MPTPHVAERPQALKVEGGINLGSDLGVLVDGDLTSLATAKANVATDVANLHVSERIHLRRVQAALEGADNFASGFTTGTSLAGINNVVTGIRAVGCAPAL
jgi:hypothetical protein